MSRSAALATLIFAFSLAWGLTACEKPEPPTPSEPEHKLSVIYPEDGAAIPDDRVAFHWTSTKAGGFDFRLYEQGTLLAYAPTDEDHYFANLRLFPNTLYTWTLKQGAQQITRSFTVTNPLSAHLGSYPGITSFYESINGTSSTYNDTLDLSMPSKVSAVLRGGGGVTEGIISDFSMYGEINVNCGGTNYVAHLEFYPHNDSIWFDIELQLSSRGDYGSYTFHTL
jgi:hypothetical protein